MSPPASNPSGDVEGKRVVFWLFVLLAQATALVMVAYIATPAARSIRARLVFATAGDLAAPVIAWFALRAIAEPSRRWVLTGQAVAAGLATFDLSAAILGLLIRFVG